MRSPLIHLYIHQSFEAKITTIGVLTDYYLQCYTAFRLSNANLSIDYQGNSTQNSTVYSTQTMHTFIVWTLILFAAGPGHVKQNLRTLFAEELCTDGEFIFCS